MAVTADGGADGEVLTGVGVSGCSEPAAGRPRRIVYFHDPDAPRSASVVPSVFVAVRNASSQLLLVRRCDSGAWELPGGQVDVGESAVTAAMRETVEEAGVRVRITGLVGLYTDPGHVIRAVNGTVRQQFVVVLRADALDGIPTADLRETSEAMWVAPRLVARFPIERPVRQWIDDALRVDATPRLA